MKRSSINSLLLCLGLTCPASGFSEEGAAEVQPLDQDLIATPESVESSAAESSASEGQVRPEASVKGHSPQRPRNAAGATEKLPELPAGAVISNGERVSIDGKGFSIVAPQGWVVRKNLPRTSLLIQASVSAQEYPRNIAVVRFKEPKYISAASAQEFADRLVASFPQVSSAIEGYTLRSHEEIKMADGREGWLFYTEYKDAGRKMMQAHVLVSSQTNHYLATYTDVAEHFEGATNSEQFLSEAWSAMTSIELDSPTPSSEFGLRVMVAALIGIAFLLLFSTVARKYFAKRYYRSVADMDDSLAAMGNEISKSSIPNSSLIVPAVSGMDAAKATSQYSDDVIDEIVDTTVRSGFSRIVNFGSRPADTAHDDDDALEFASQSPKSHIKRGA